MWLGFIIVTFITLPAMTAMRAILGRRVAELMLKRSPTATAAMAAVQEVPAPTVPTVRVVEAASPAAQTDDARHAQTQQARALFRRWCMLDLSGAALVFVLPALVYLVSESPLDTIIGFGDFGLGGWVALYMLVVSLRYVFYARQYRNQAIRAAKRVGFFRRWVTMVFEQLFKAFFHPRYAWFPFAVFAMTVLWNSMFDWHSQLVFPTVVLALAVHLGLRILVVRQAQTAANRRLLILRVFGRDANTELTFGALRRFWQHIGSSFTVVDRSYLGYKYRGHSEDHVAIVFFSCMPVAIIGLWSGNVPELEVWAGLGVMLGLMIILGYAVALAVLHIRAPRFFASDRSHIRTMLQGVLRRPRRWSLSFRELDMYCFDNTWRDAVAEFVAASDVVLMDLRGYSDTNKGCEYEVDFLFDSIPVDRITFLVDKGNDIQMVESLVMQRWEKLNKDSPNLKVRNPVITFYKSSNQGTADVRGLVNVLFGSVSLSGKVGA